MIGVLTAAAACVAFTFIAAAMLASLVAAGGADKRIEGMRSGGRGR